MAYSVMVPDVVMRPILPPLSSVNHNAPSGPVVMPRGLALSVGTGYSLMVPAVVIRPILLPQYSVNHTAPSGPVATPKGVEPDDTAYSVIVVPAAIALVSTCVSPATSNVAIRPTDK